MPDTIESNTVLEAGLHNLKHQEDNREVPEESLKYLFNLLEMNYFNIFVNQKTKNINPGLSDQMEDIIQGTLEVILQDINNILNSNSGALDHVLEDKVFMSNAKITTWFKLFCTYQDLKNQDVSLRDDVSRSIAEAKDAVSPVMTTLNLNALDQFIKPEDCIKINALDSIYNSLIYPHNSIHDFNLEPVNDTPSEEVRFSGDVNTADIDS